MLVALVPKKMKNLILSSFATKWFKTVHIFFACAWGGSASSIFAIHSLFIPDTGPELYARNLSLIYIDNHIVIPSAVGCLVTGFVYSQFTTWGYVKYYWVIAKWATLGIVIIAGLVWFIPWLDKMAELSNTVRGMAKVDPSYHIAMNTHTIMAAGQIIIIFFLVAISVFKPWGKTRRK